MRKIATLAFALLLLSCVQAKSQDALGTFIFLFLDSKIDVNRNYGTEFQTSWVGPSGPMSEKKVAFSQTMRIRDKCVFESIVKRDGDVSIVTVWDFNKAFFGEAKVYSVGNYVGFKIPGEKGLWHETGFCDKVVDRDCAKKYPRGTETDKEEITLSGSEQTFYSLQYFVSNFCAGTKRKSAF